MYILLEYWDASRMLHDTEVVEHATLALGSGWQVRSSHETREEAEQEADRLRSEAQARGYARGHYWAAQY